MKVYCVVSVVNGACVASWVLASDPDQATEKATSRLPEGAKIKIVVPLSEASLKQFEKNKLYELLPMEDGVEFVEFTSNNMLFLVQLQQIEIDRLRESLHQLTLRRQANNNHGN